VSRYDQQTNYPRLVRRLKELWVDVFDAASGVRYDTRTVSAFGGGVYLVFNVSGHVRFQFTSLAGPNAVLSGLFLS
jgi:hypothetical protein